MSTFTVAKRFKRLWIDQDGRPVYTPPNFLRLPDRKCLQELASAMSLAGCRDIGLIMDFEAKYSPRR